MRRILGGKYYRKRKCEKINQKNKNLIGISTNILLLGMVSFLNDLSSEMIIPILPMFITALGTFHTTTGLAALPASLMAGFLWQINPSITFIYGAVVSIISVILFLVFRNYFRKE